MTHFKLCPAQIAIIYFFELYYLQVIIKSYYVPFFSFYQKRFKNPVVARSFVYCICSNECVHAVLI